MVVLPGVLGSIGVAGILVSGVSGVPPSGVSGVPSPGSSFVPSPGVYLNHLLF